jgi:hypothetical protein
MAISKGSTVRQVVPVIEGDVKERRFNESADEMEYLVGYEVDGEAHERWFTESQIEETV